MRTELPQFYANQRFRHEAFGGIRRKKRPSGDDDCQKRITPFVFFIICLRLLSTRWQTRSHRLAVHRS